MTLLIHLMMLFWVDVVIGLILKWMFSPLLLFVWGLCLFEQFKKMGVFLVNSSLFFDSAVDVVADLKRGFWIWRFRRIPLHDWKHIVEQMLVGSKDVSITKPLISWQRPVLKMGVELWRIIVHRSLYFGYSFEQVGILLLLPNVKKLTWGCTWGSSGFLKNSLI